VHTEFCVGVAITAPIRAAITAACDWVAALDGDGSPRDGAELVELTDYRDAGVHPHRQDHGLRPVPVPAVRDQRRLARTRPDRHRPALLDPAPAPGRRDGRRRAEEVHYRLLHVAGKLSRTARTTTLRIAADWPWTNDLIRAFERLAVLPEPVTCQQNPPPTHDQDPRSNPAYDRAIPADQTADHP
jgi:hypothetical protein